LEFSGSTGVWNPVPTIFYIGNYQTHSNAAGGVAYGYEGIDQSTGVVYGCDSMVWATGDALNLSSQIVYGIAGISSSGNAPSPDGIDFSPLNSYYVDVDNEITLYDKTQIGDVDIFQCACPGESTVPSCDSTLMATANYTGSQDSCCWTVDMKIEENNICMVEFEVLGGVIFNDFVANGGWNIAPDALNPNQIIEVTPALPGDFPIGTISSAIDFCLTEINSAADVPQIVIIRYFRTTPNGLELLECNDTLYFDCPVPNSNNGCWSAEVDSVYCNPDDQSYTIKLNITNESATETFHTLGILDVLPDVCFDLTSLPLVSLPSPIGPGESGQVCLTVQSNKQILSTTNVYFKFFLFSDNACCHAADSLCVPLPPCCIICDENTVLIDTVASQSDSCCYALDVKNGCAKNYFKRIETEILTPGVTFSQAHVISALPILWGTPFGNDTEIHWAPQGGFIPAGTFDNLINFCLSNINDASQNPQCVEVRWIACDVNGQDSVACRDTLKFYCEPVVRDSCIALTERDIDCLPNGNYQFNYTIQNISTNFASHFSIYDVLPPSVNTIPPVVLANVGLNPGDTWSGSLVITGASPGDVVKLKTRLFDFTPPPPGVPFDTAWCCFDTICITIPNCLDSCVCSTAPLTLIQNGISYTLPCTQGAPTPAIGCPTGDVNISGFFGCKDPVTGEPCEDSNVSWTLYGPGGIPITSGATTNFLALTFPEALVDDPGSYLLSVTTICQGASDTCVCNARWIQPDCPSVDTCCQNYQQFVQNIQSAVSVSVDNSQCKATINIGTLESCDLVQSINWGDGNIQTGPFTSGSMPMHTYPTSGAYNIGVLANEYRPDGTICYEYFLNFPINLQCPDSCYCQGFQNLTFFNNSGFGLPVTCDDQTIYELPCPDTSGGYQLKGEMHCSTSCGKTVDWTITSADGSIIFSGSLVVSGSSPYLFTIPTIPYSTFPDPGIYQLNLYGNCGGQVCLCTVLFAVPECRTCPTCPAGTVQGPNLVQNGDFSSGNVGFTSDYSFIVSGVMSADGYSIRNSTNLSNGLWACTDHTALLPLGQFLICDASPNTADACYRNTIPVTVGTTYVFCAYTNNLVRPTSDFNDPTVQVWINGVMVDNVLLTETPDNWVMLSATWTATTASAVIEIKSAGTSSSGNDFAIDDVSFAKCGPACTCGNFIKTYIRNKKTGLSQLLTCNSPQAVSIPCPPSGKPHVVTGSLRCNGNCQATNVSWSMMAPDGTNVLSGSSLSAYFSIPIPSTAVTQNGVYMLKLQGICNGDTCECKINLAFEGCGPDCDCAELEEAVVAGIHISSLGGCQKEIHSNATLTECDKVEWTIYNFTQLSPIFTGTTTGDDPLIYSFPGAGKYSICMKVTRTQPDGTTCMYENCWKVKVTCGGLPTLNCENPVLSNPGFSEQSNPGILGQQGKSAGWSNLGGTPEVVMDESCADPVSMRLLGNCLITDLVGHEAVNLAQGKSLSYEICIRPQATLVPGAMLVGRISTSPQAAANCEGECEEVFRVPACCIAFDSFSVVTGAFQSKFVLGDNRFFSLHVENDHVDDDPESRSGVLVDNICLQLEDLVSAVDNGPDGKLGISFFPNPTTGKFTLRVNGQVPLGAELQITDVCGRILQTNHLTQGQYEYQFTVDALSSGIYFLKLVDGRMPIWVGKLIKQQ
ncbi:MAG: T9SS type A sorting domain-containing protein, partial [Saprospiraceae bacterium]|nr:T9SS type A sorting domain-containing protein [Saprospiraceae bacterium]